MNQSLRAVVVLSLPVIVLLAASAAPRWAMTYARQHGRFLTAGVGGQAELFATQEDGDYADIGMTNDANPSFAVFGYTGRPPADPYTPGNVRVGFDPNNLVYDFQVYDPGTPSDRSPDCHWLESLPDYGHYRFEFWWRRVADDSQYTFFPNQPVYHYDHVQGFNTSTSEPPGYRDSREAYGLTDWADEHWQTFVVPQGIDRIIGAKCFAVRQAGAKLGFTLTIHDGVGGTQIGPSASSREINSNEFVNVKVAWDMDAIPVQPGRAYALRATWPGGFNIFGTNNDSYTNGMLYNGRTPLPNRDMVAVIVGAYAGGAPVPTPTPTMAENPTPTPTFTRRPPIRSGADIEVR